jgi:2-polyprenyl-6-hydroxyphenyl methylase/3-demethylubiquinone-9 3-methyltransferase
LSAERTRTGETRVFELGSGSGAVANALAAQGFEVIGIDPSETGLDLAREAYPHLHLEHGTCYENLASRFGTFPMLLSLEVIEHVYAPREYMKSVYDLLEPGGMALISTPYHGYLKNVALSLSGKMDGHFAVLTDGGHIKFWSVRTLGILAREAGFTVERWRFAGRVPFLWKSMIVTLRK